MKQMKQDDSVREIVILGGGTAGWMTAAFLNKGLCGEVNITLIESPKIPTIGVGEASIPSIKPEFFDFLGIPEEEWMRECNATFKIGIKFVGWAHPPDRTEGNSFYHIFGEAALCEGLPLTHYWIRKRLQGFDRPMAYACYPSAEICDAGKSPKFLDGCEAVPYAYHFDAGLLGEFLKKWSVARGVAHVRDDVVDVPLGEQGDIEALVTESGRRFPADLFIDCTGFAGLLLNEVLGEPFLSFSESLLCDRAVALQTPFEEGEGPTNPYTTSIALSSGWVWSIPLSNRRGNGYVYSGSFLTPDEAERELREFLGPAAEGRPAKHLGMRIGRTRNQWVKNCVGIGLAGGFLEPLESTGLYCIYAALFQLLRYFPRKTIDPVLRNKFNERTSFMVDDIKDFIVLHYCSTSRSDTPFWRANREDLVVPDTLQEDLELYRAGVPIKIPFTGRDHYNRLVFDASFDRFWTNSNYTAILTGMNVLPEREISILAFNQESVEKADQMFRSVSQQTETLLAQLPSHSHYVERLQEGSLP